MLSRCLLVLAGCAVALLAIVRAEPARASAALADTSYAMLAQTLTSFEEIKKQNGEFQPNDKPTLFVTRAEGPIRIDGNLTDPGWQGAARAVNFTETNPGDRTKPPVGTEAWVAYDDENLYVAFVAEDDNPQSIRASLRDRDQIFQDDFVGMIIDTYGQATWAYEIFANPLGVQGDLKWTQGSEDAGFDIVFDTSGRITDGGYVVEFAIPFSSLRFPNSQQQSWKMTFWRTHPRDSRRQYSWAATSRDEPCWPCQWGTLTGISRVKPGSKLALLPSITANQTSLRLDEEDPFSSVEDQGVEADFGLGARYSFTTNLVGEATINPDFSQIESDVAQIDVNSTFALFFPERRPFFQEGGDLLATPVSAIYTRSINDPQFAGRFTGRLGNTAIAVIGARDERGFALLPFEESSETVEIGEANSAIGRLKQNFGQDSFVGALGTTRHYDVGGSGSLAGVDGTVRFFKNYRFEFQGLGSYTDEPNAPLLTEDVNGMRFDNDRYTADFDGESYFGHQLYTSIEKDGRYWEFDVDYWEWSPTFRADNGFVTTNNRRQANWWTGYFIRPSSGFFNLVLPNVNGGQIWNFDGKSKDQWIWTEVWTEFKAQTSGFIAFQHFNENFKGVQFDDMQRIIMRVNSNFSDPIRLGFWGRTGENIARNEDVPLRGKGQDFEAWGTIKPFNRLVFEPLLSYSRLKADSGEEIFNGYIFRLKTQYQFSRPLFFRLIVQYNEFDDLLNVDPLLSYKINPFSVFFLGSSHNYEDIQGKRGFQQQTRQIFAKVQYLFQM